MTTEYKDDPLAIPAFLRRTGRPTPTRRKVER